MTLTLPRPALGLGRWPPWTGQAGWSRCAERTAAQGRSDHGGRPPGRCLDPLGSSPGRVAGSGRRPRPAPGPATWRANLDRSCRPDEPDDTALAEALSQPLPDLWTLPLTGLVDGGQAEPAPDRTRRWSGQSSRLADVSGGWWSSTCPSTVGPHVDAALEAAEVLLAVGRCHSAGVRGARAALGLWRPPTGIRRRPARSLPGCAAARRWSRVRPAHCRASGCGRWCPMRPPGSAQRPRMACCCWTARTCRRACAGHVSQPAAGLPQAGRLIVSQSRLASTPHQLVVTSNRTRYRCVAIGSERAPRPSIVVAVGPTLASATRADLAGCGCWPSAPDGLGRADRPATPPSGTLLRRLQGRRTSAGNGEAIALPRHGATGPSSSSSKSQTRPSVGRWWDTGQPHAARG